MPLTKKAERTKAKLTASARKLISERGFDNVSVEENHERCRCGKRHILPLFCMQGRCHS